jgi:hypothetical protein
MTSIQHVDGDTSWLFLRPVSLAMTQELEEHTGDPDHEQDPQDRTRAPKAQAYSS